jgi:fermentation-respiration switch protein FrsA (DUF1100 family)
LPRLVAGRLFNATARTLGADPRDTEPIRLIGLLEGVDLFLISGQRDATVPVADARRLSAAAPVGTIHWVVPGAGHREAHKVDPPEYEARTTRFLRSAFLDARGADL